MVNRTSQIVYHESGPDESAIDFNPFQSLLEKADTVCRGNGSEVCLLRGPCTADHVKFRKGVDCWRRRLAAHPRGNFPIRGTLLGGLHA